MGGSEYLDAYNRGLDLAAAGDAVGAGEAFRRAAEADPADADSLSDLGRIEIRRGRLGAAKEALEEALRRDPRHAGAWNNLGVAHFLGEDYGEASRCFSLAVEIDAALADAWFNLADAREALGDAEGSREASARYRALEDSR